MKIIFLIILSTILTEVCSSFSRYKNKEKENYNSSEKTSNINSAIVEADAVEDFINTKPNSSAITPKRKKIKKNIERSEENNSLPYVKPGKKIKVGNQDCSNEILKKCFSICQSQEFKCYRTIAYEYLNDKNEKIRDIRSNACMCNNEINPLPKMVTVKYQYFAIKQEVEQRLFFIDENSPKA